MKIIIKEDTEITLNGKKYLLEKGDIFEGTDRRISEILLKWDTTAGPEDVDGMKAMSKLNGLSDEELNNVYERAMAGTLSLEGFIAPYGRGND